MDLNEIAVFVEIAQRGSVTAAAKALDIPKSSVSRKLASLEDRLGTRLLHRTTREIRLTDVGAMYLERCREVLARARAADQLVAETRARPCGRLRVTAPPTFAFLGSIAADYLARYPDVSVELACTERHVDLIAEGFDLAVRAGPLPDSSLIARKVASVSRLLVASSGYLERRDGVRSPENLHEHDTIVFVGGRERGSWILESRGGSIDIEPGPRLVVDDYATLLEATRQGLGIALLPEYACREDLARGTLVRVLPRWRSPAILIRAVYPAGEHPPKKLTAFLEILQEELPRRLGELTMER